VSFFGESDKLKTRIYKIHFWVLENEEYERQIDQMVYELYGLTPEEIEIVESFNKH